MAAGGNLGLGVSVFQPFCCSTICLFNQHMVEQHLKIFLKQNRCWKKPFLCSTWTKALFNLNKSFVQLEQKLISTHFWFNNIRVQTWPGLLTWTLQHPIWTGHVTFFFSSRDFSRLLVQVSRHQFDSNFLSRHCFRYAHLCSISPASINIFTHRYHFVPTLFLNYLFFSTQNLPSQTSFSINNPSFSKRCTPIYAQRHSALPTPLK